MCQLTSVSSWLSDMLAVTVTHSNQSCSVKLVTGMDVISAGLKSILVLRQNLPIKIDKMSRTAGSGDPKDSDSFSSKRAAIFLVGGSVGRRR